MTWNLESPGNPANREPNRVATVGQLRAALQGIPDDTPLIVNAADPDYPEAVAEQVITSTGFGLVDWGDGYGLEPDNLFALNCHMAGMDPRGKPVRSSRRPEAAASLVAEPEPGCETCGAVTGLEKVTSHPVGGGATRTQWFCADAAACHERAFPGLTELLGSGWPGTTRPEPEAEP
jgi:hypothetical protein